jgi:hypothetical protein
MAGPEGLEGLDNAGTTGLDLKRASTLRVGAMSDADERGERIVQAVTAWPGITIGDGDFGETDFLLNGHTIGHVHGGYMADIPFPRRIRDELVAAGRTGPHHVHPDSGWTTLYIRSDADVDETIALLRLNYDRATARAARRAG